MLVHRNPRLLERAIGALSSEDSGFFIHVDAKSVIPGFSGIVGKNIFFCEHRIPVYWAEFSNVEAILQVMQMALTSTVRYDYFVFMQGADYPLRSREYIQEFFDENRGKEFMSMVEMPAPGFPLSKINTLRFTSDKPFRRFLTRGLAKLGLATRDYRKYLGELKPYAGDACWALSREACEYIVEFSHRRPEVSAYFRNTHVPEESFFHTILGNSKFRDRVQKSLLYRYWPVPGHHPEMLSEKQVQFFEMQDKVWTQDQFGEGEALFARKFSDDSLNLVDRIDAMIEKKESLRRHSLPRTLTEVPAKLG